MLMSEIFTGIEESALVEDFVRVWFEYEYGVLPWTA